MHHINNNVKSVFRILIYKISNDLSVFQLGENLFPDKGSFATKEVRK